MGTNSDFRVDFIIMNQSKLSVIVKNPTNFVKHNQSKLETLYIPKIRFDTATDLKYLDIIYYKWNRHESVSSNQRIHIDYDKAVSEMEKLDWTFVHNHIGFVNELTNQTIQAVKLEANKWYVEELINLGPDWEGYAWYSETTSSNFYYVVWLFYQEKPFAQILQWKLKRVRLK